MDNQVVRLPNLNLNFNSNGVIIHNEEEEDELDEEDDDQEEDYEEDEDEEDEDFVGQTTTRRANNHRPKSSSRAKSSSFKSGRTKSNGSSTKFNEQFNDSGDLHQSSIISSMSTNPELGDLSEDEQINYYNDGEDLIVNNNNINNDSVKITTVSNSQSNSFTVSPRTQTRQDRVNYKHFL